ncbi:MAG: hypothetical protein EBV97_03800 [Rhodobacteraceae bacterium]|nr:hypothetical protein [Paracoccaceae bacterium]
MPVIAQAVDIYRDLATESCIRTSLDLESNVTAFDRFVVLLKALRRSHLFFNSYPLVLLINS